MRIIIDDMLFYDNAGFTRKIRMYEEDDFKLMNMHSDEAT
jgi:hypothetical protein